MKYHFLSLPIICLLAFSTGCKKKTEINYQPTPAGNTLNGSTTKGDLASVLKSAALKPEVFTVNATTGGKFTSSKGLTYTIDPGIFLKPDGQTAQGTVSVEVSEITKASEMILNDMPTNAITTPVDSARKDTVKIQKPQEVGGMLNSFGEIKVEASQNNEELELKPDAEIKVQIPQPAVPEPILPMETVQTWENHPVSGNGLIGHNSENENVTGEITNFEKCGIWKIIPQVCIPHVNENNVQCLNMEIPKLDVWFNSDILIVTPRQTTVLGYFTNVFNDNETADALQGRQANMLFFKKKGDNTLIKLFNHILNAADGKKGFLSVQQSFGIGMEGTFLALVSKDGKFYAEKKAVTIAEPASGKNFVGINFTLKEITESQMLALIETMNNE